MEDQSNFDELKQKYQPILDLLVESGVCVTRLELQDHKLLVEGEAPSEHIQQELTARICELYSGLVCDLRVNLPGSQTAEDAGLATEGEIENYVVTDLLRAEFENES